MQISKKLILELRKIIKDDYDRRLSFEKTAEIARDLVGYFDLLAKIHHKNADVKH